MTEYVLHIKASAQKEMDALTDSLFARIDKKIIALASQPRPAGSKKLKGLGNYWRIRIGDYRVIYAINDTGHRIDIIRVAHRKEVYL